MWAAYLKASGSPETTTRLRVYQVGRLAGELGGSPASVTADDLAEVLAGHTWAPNTRRTYRAALRAFYAWAVAARLVEQSPALLLAPVRVPRPRARPAPEDAVQTALLAAPARERLAILLAATCGLRRGELARMRREHVERDLVGWSLRVKGKGGHVRAVPLPAGLARELLEGPPGWVFPSTHGGHLTPHHLGKVISRWLPEGLTTHSLRHRCATVAYAATRDLRAVQELLGHAKPETTAAYTAVPDRAVRDAVTAAAV